MPILGLTYWSFRIMIGLGFFMVGLAAVGLWLMRKGRDPGKWFTRFAILGMFAPLLANSAGWTFTEVGPPAVGGPGAAEDRRRRVADREQHGAARRWSSLTLLYAGLAVVEVWLFTRVARGGPDPAPQPVSGPDGDNYLPSLAY